MAMEAELTPLLCFVLLSSPLFSQVLHCSPGRIIIANSLLFFVEEARLIRHVNLFCVSHKKTGVKTRGKECDRDRKRFIYISVT